MCFAAGVTFARTRGIIPASEPTHALAEAIDEAKRCARTGEEKVILTALYGHGHFDMSAYQRFLSGEMEDYELPQERIDAALTRLPDLAM
jgi:tryptophan synthase beta chain